MIFYKIPNREEFQILNKKNYKIEYNKTTQNWIITEPNGIKYFFEEKNGVYKTRPFYLGDGKYTKYLNGEELKLIPTRQSNIDSNHFKEKNSWKLTKIEGKNLNLVTFSYEKLQTMQQGNLNNEIAHCKLIRYENIRQTGLGSVLSAEPTAATDYDPDVFSDCKTYNSVPQTYENSILTEVVFNGNKIIFNNVSRNDMIGDKRYFEINIKNKENIVKKINFFQSYYPINHPLSNRLKLDSLKINDKKYTFQYNEGNSNMKKYADYWGYFNGLESKTHFINPFRILPKNQIHSLYINMMNELKDTENKSAHPENSKIGTLKKIIYPTGGFTELEYELNTFNNYIFPNYDNKVTVEISNYSFKNTNIDTNFANRSSNILNFEANQTITGSVTYLNGISTTCLYSDKSYFKIVKIPDSWINTYNSGTSGKETFWNLVEQNAISVETLYAKSITNGEFQFYTPKTFNFNISIPTTGKYVAIVKYDARCTPNQPIGEISTNFKVTQFKDYEQTESQGYGLRVKSTTDSPDGIQKYLKKYTYFGGKHIPYFKSIDIENSQTYIRDCNKTYGGNSVIGNTCNYRDISFIPVSTNNLFQRNLFGGGDFVGYDRVEEEEFDLINNNQKGKIINYFTNRPDVSSVDKFRGSLWGSDTSYLEKFGMSLRSSDTENGKLIKQEVFDSSNKKMQETEHFYKDIIHFNTKQCFNIKILDGGLKIHWSCGANDTGSGNYCNTLTQKEKYFFYYPLKGIETKLDKKITKEFFPTGEVITTNSYSYDDRNQLISESISSSNDKTLGVSYKYPYSATNKSFMTDLITQNRMSEIVETTKTNNGLVKEVNSVDYAKDATTKNLVLQKTIFSSKGNNSGSLERKFTYDLYDDKGNLLQYTLENGQPVSIIWGYNGQYPIAKLEGIAYSSIPSTTITDLQTKSNADLDATSENTLITALNTLRTNVATSSALITTYSYDPLIGVTTITQPNGLREKYVYDAFGRLKHIEDLNGKKLKEFEYNFKP